MKRMLHAYLIHEASFLFLRMINVVSDKCIFIHLLRTTKKNLWLFYKKGEYWFPLFLKKYHFLGTLKYIILNFNVLNLSIR